MAYIHSYNCVTPLGTTVRENVEALLRRRAVRHAQTRRMQSHWRARRHFPRRPEGDGRRRRRLQQSRLELLDDRPPARRTQIGRAHV